MNFSVTQRRIGTLVRYARSYGIKSAVGYAIQRLKARPLPGLVPRTDVIGFYDFVTLPPAAASVAAGDVGHNTINWFIPPVGKGSGGHLNIFRFIANLEGLGYDCRIVIVGTPRPVSAMQARREISDWFFPLKANVFIDTDKVPPARVTVATEWRTAYWVRNFGPTVHRCYFVQDFEPSFFPMGSEYVFAEETYRFGFVGITAGGWLKEKLAADYGMRTHAVGFSYDKDLYRQIARPPQAGGRCPRVLFYARPPTPRRAFELGLLALHEVSRRMPGVEVVFAGWDLSGYSIPFRHQSAGLLVLSELPALYASCDAALVISLTNLSLLPLELMACGVPVVSNRAPCTEWLLTDENSRLTPPTVDGLADGVCEVLGDPQQAARLVRAGLATVAATDWQAEAVKMTAVLEAL